MTTVHPTAVVDPRARLAATVLVGAFSVIGPDVTLGEGAEIGHHCVLEGPVEIGARVKIGHGSVLGAPPQDLKFRPGTVSGVKIGAGTELREYVTVHRATTPEGITAIGGDCLVMTMCHVGHDCHVGDGVILVNAVNLSGHVRIEEHATIGGLTGVHQFCRIGAFAYVGGFAKIVQDVPPYMLVDGSPGGVCGVNVIGLRRHGMAAEDRRVLQRAHRLLYRSGLSPAAATERIKRELPGTPPLARLLEFIAGSRRGICGPFARRRGAAGDRRKTMPQGDAE